MTVRIERVDAHHDGAAVDSTRTSRSQPTDPLHDRLIARPRGERGLDAICDVLARAYAANPLICWVLPDASTREAGTHAWLRPSIARYLAGGVVHVARDDDVIVGVAAWRPAHTDVAGHLVDGPTPGQALASLVGDRRAQEVLDALAGTATMAPAGPADYLNYLAVDPRHQGRGHGRRLVRAGIEGADERGHDTWLGTTDPDNVPFYEQAGYRLAGRRVLGDGPVLAVLHRSGQASGSAVGGAAGRDGTGSANQTTVSP